MFKYLKTKSKAFVLVLILTLCVTPILGAFMVYAMDETIEKELVLYAPKGVSGTGYYTVIGFLHYPEEKAAKTNMM